jgi:hypothetical protein
MSTFENGWVCKQCWKANRDEDIRCYRCKALHPDLPEAEGSPRERLSARKALLEPAASTARTIADASQRTAKTGRRIGRRAAEPVGKGVRVAGSATISGYQEGMDAVRAAAKSSETAFRAGRREASERFKTLQRLVHRGTGARDPSAR